MARDELLVLEKAHTRAGDAIAAARRRLPMTEVPPDTTVIGPDGPVPFGDVFEGRDELVVYSHMFYAGEPWEWQCEGCTRNSWNMGDAADAAYSKILGAVPAARVEVESWGRSATDGTAPIVGLSSVFVRERLEERACARA